MRTSCGPAVAPLGAMSRLVPFYATIACGALWALASACSPDTLANTPPEADPACVDCEPDAPKDGPVDAGPAPETDGDATNSDATNSDPTDGAPPSGPTVDPQCERKPFGLGVFGYTTRETAMPVDVPPYTSVSGVMSQGNASGDPPPRWFTFEVTSPTVVDVGFNGLKAYAAFYFESSETSQFSVGYPQANKYGVTLQPGRYYVKVADTLKRYFGDGPAFEVNISWSTPPAVCTDGGT